MAEVSPAGRTLIDARALGLCEYRGLPETLGFVEHQIDHIVAIKHGGSSEPDNLALSCTLCNRYKGSDISSIDPETGKIEPLYNPRKQAWGRHFRFAFGGRITGISRAGRATVRLLQLNRPDRLRERPERFDNADGPRRSSP